MSGRRRDRAFTKCHQQLLRTQNASPHRQAHAVATLVEVAHRSRCGPATDPGTECAAGPWNDCANLSALVAEAHQLIPIGCVLADAEFDSERNRKFCREKLKAKSIIPAKRGKKTWKIHGIRAEMRNNFHSKEYGRRSLVETVFSTTRAFLLILWSGEVGYEWPFFDGTSTLTSAFSSTSLGNL